MCQLDHAWQSVWLLILTTSAYHTAPSAITRIKGVDTGETCSGASHERVLYSNLARIIQASDMGRIAVGWCMTVP